MSLKSAAPQSTSYLPTTLGLFVMLYLLGSMGLVFVYSSKLVTYAKENISFYIELKDEANEAAVFAFQKKIEIAPYTKPQTVRYISKDEALKTLTQEGATKEEMMPFGENLLPNMLEFKLRSDYKVDNEQIIKEIKKNDFVEDVFYTETPVETIASKVYLLKIILSVLMLFFIFVVINLLQNKLNQLLSTNKTEIQIMQMAGATSDYIAQPYLRQSLKNGFIASILAIIAVWTTRYLFDSGLDTSALNLETWIILLFVVLMLIGILFPWGITKYKVQKYLSK